jgi:hypothetical protein
VKIHNTSDNATLLPFFNQIGKIINNTEFIKLNDEQTLYRAYAHFEGGPRNLIKFRRSFFEGAY